MRSRFFSFCLLPFAFCLLVASAGLRNRPLSVCRNERSYSLEFSAAAGLF